MDAIRHKQQPMIDPDDDEYAGFFEEVRSLIARRKAAEARKPALTWTWEPTGQTYREAWS